MGVCETVKVPLYLKYLFNKFGLMFFGRLKLLQLSLVCSNSIKQLLWITCTQLSDICISYCIDDRPTCLPTEKREMVRFPFTTIHMSQFFVTNIFVVDDEKLFECASTEPIVSSDG